MTPADAIRKVTAKMQTELEAGRRSAHLDAHDLIDLLLAVADELEAAPNNVRKPGKAYDAAR